LIISYIEDLTTKNDMIIRSL